MSRNTLAYELLNARFTFSVCLLFLCAGILAVLAARSDAATVVVSPGGAGDGSSWQSPLGSVQTAIDLSLADLEIWVASGTYNEHITLVTGTSLFGGFQGGESEREERDWIENETVLMGDAAAGRVVTATEVSRIVVDGFTITNGVGGVLFERVESATLSNCVIRNNEGDVNGAGVACLSASTTISDCLVTQNRACCGGGGLYAESSIITILNSVFTDNHGSDGGGIRVFISESLITDCTISHNTAEDGGGATLANGSTTLHNCTISNNTAEFGAGLQITDPSCEISNCKITENWAAYGTGVFLKQSNANLSNCLIAENLAVGRDGAGVFVRGSSPTLTNCTIAANDAADAGVGLSGFDSNPVLTNCIFWNLNVDEFAVEGVSPEVTYSGVRGGYPGTGNIDLDPLFSPQGPLEYSLLPNSPCIDAGSPGADSSDACLPPGLETLRNDMGMYGGPLNCAWLGRAPAPTPFVPSDLNVSNTVDAVDLLRILRVWNETILSSSPEDLFDDETMNLLDLAIFQEDWRKFTETR